MTENIEILEKLKDLERRLNRLEEIHEEREMILELEDGTPKEAPRHHWV